MSSQPISGHQYGTITGGTAAVLSLVSDLPAVVRRVFVPGTYVGTVKIHDAASTAGTTATSSIFTIGLPTTSVPFSVQLDTQFKKGIVVEADGTPNMTLLWDR